MSADDLLLARARALDEASFERLIRPHLEIGYRLAVSILNDRAQAEDAVQEALWRAWRGIGQLRSSSRIRSWFLTIVVNRSRSQRRRHWWSVGALPPSVTVPGPAESSDRRADLIRALSQLKPDERAAIFLRFYGQLSSMEIGQVLGISAVGARSRVHRALHRMRIELSEDEP